MKEVTSFKLACTLARVLDDYKAQNITILDISNVSVLADYFVIATGKTERQTQALCDIVENELSNMVSV